MAHIPNKARERLAAGQLALGMALRQARTVEIGRVLAACGFDFAFVDMEHNTMSIDTAAQIAVACHDAGVTPLVRVPGYEHHLATRLLDAGAMGIVFPHVDTPEHAKQLVSHGKYPGMGGIYDHPTMEKYIKMGARFVLSGSDLSFIMTGGQARADFLRRISV